MEPATVSTPAPESLDPLNAIRILRSAGGSLLDQAALHGQLLHTEWAAEKRRLLKMHLAILLGFAFLLCTMLACGALVLALGWETVYRIPIMLALMAVYGLGAVFAWRRFLTLSALGGQAFAASREELSADLALLRSRL